MTKSFFEPWVGKNYLNDGFNNKKILVLGESHYCEEELCEDCGALENRRCKVFTINTIKNYLSYKIGDSPHEGWMNTFTKFTNVMTDNNDATESIEQFWNSVIFYNYVQIALTGSRKSPEKQDFEKSYDPFIEILKAHKPDFVIVWGLRLWNSLPDTGVWGPEILDGKYWKIYYYNVDEKQIPLFCVYHPSSTSFSGDIKKYIDAAINMK